MNDNRMVVVVTRATTVRLESHDDVFAARFKKLGLTAYGHNKTEAMSNLKKLFNRFIHLHRDGGTLEARLEQAGVEWSWADEYTGNYEDTNQEKHAPAEQSSPNGPGSSGTTALLATAA